MTDKLVLGKYIAGAIVVIFYQAIIAPRTRILGVEADMAVILTIWIALNHGLQTGVYFGFIMGFLTGVFNPLNLGWSCLLLSSCGLITGIIKNKLVVDPIPVRLLILLLVAFVYDFVYIFCTQMDLALGNITYTLSSSFFTALYSALVGALIYYIIKHKSVLRNLF